MSRSLLLSCACLLAGFAVMVPLTLRGEEPKELKIIASATTAEPVLIKLKKDDSGVVIRSAEDLVAHSSKAETAKDPAVQKVVAAELAKLLKIDSIDWGKHMILAVQGRPTNGESGTIKFEPLKNEGKSLTLIWKQENHASRAPYRGPPTGFALVERFEQEVLFFPRELTDSLGINLLLIPRGKFLMGSPKSEEGRLDDELQHEVEITQPFYLGKHEVTVGQFKAFVEDAKYVTEAEKDGKGGRAFDGKEFVQKPEFTWQNLHFRQSNYDPVVIVTWQDAVAFCTWLSKKEGKIYRLPTEAEWEYACRAGTKTRFNTGENEEDLKAVGNIADASLKKKWMDAAWAMSWNDGFPFTAPVGRFQANAFGLHDMHGNVWEWCSDWYGEDYYGNSPKQNPQGPATGKERISRGGAWSTQPKFCRSAFRDWHEPGYRSDCVGFRVVSTTAK